MFLVLCWLAFPLLMRAGSSGCLPGPGIPSAFADLSPHRPGLHSLWTAGRLQEGPANSIAKQCWGAPGQRWHPVPRTIPWVRTGEARKNETREEALLMLPLSQGLLSPVPSGQG